MPSQTPATIPLPGSRRRPRSARPGLPVVVAAMSGTGVIVAGSGR